MEGLLYERGDVLEELRLQFGSEPLPEGAGRHGRWTSLKKASTPAMASEVHFVGVRAGRQRRRSVAARGMRRVIVS